MMKQRTWKRVLAAVCAGVAAVSMAACGGGTNNTAKDGVIINSVMNSTSQASLNYIRSLLQLSRVVLKVVHIEQWLVQSTDHTGQSCSRERI